MMAKARSLPTEKGFSDELLQTIFTQAADGIFVSELQGRYVDVNPRGCEMLGYTREEILKLSVHDLIAPEDLSIKPFKLDILRNGKTIVTKRILRRKDGTLLPTEISAKMLSNGNLLGIVRDISERKRAQEEVKKSGERYRHLFDNNPHPMLVYDLKTLIFLAVNDAAIKKYGYTREEFLSMTVADIRPKQDLPRFMEHLAQPREALKHSEGWQHRLKDGTIIDVEVSSHTLDFDGHEAALVLAQDVTERKKAEVRIQHITRLYATLSQVNQTIVRVKQRDELFEAICKVVVEFGGFHMAWIGLLEEGTGDVNPAARAGYEEGYLRSIQVNINDDLRGKPLAGMAVHTGKVVSVDDIRTDPRTEFWREQALKRNYYSMASVPLRLKGNIIGVLNLYAKETGLFSGEELQLLEEIGTDISFALDAIETETQQKQAEKALGESERRYRRTLTNMMEGCQIIDYDWRYIYINDAAAQQGHRKPDELLMHTMMDIYPGIEKTELFGILQVCMQERRSHRMENEFIYPDGSVGCFELSIQPVPEGLFILSIDITHRKKVEGELRASEDRYRDLVENSRELICTHDLEGKILSANKWALQMMGIDNEEDVVGRNIADFIVPEHRAEFQNYLQTIQRQETAQGIMVVQTVKGERRIWEYNNSLRTDGVSTPIVRGMAIDVTESRQAEARLKASEEKYRSLFNNVPDGVFRTTIDGRLLAANPALVQMLGYDSAEELQAANIADMYFDPSERLNFIDRVSTENEVRNLEVRLKRKDGRQIVGLNNSRAVRDEIGKILYFEGTLTDITERKRAVEALRASQEQLHSFVVQAPISMAMFDREMHYLAASHRWVVEYGRGYENLIGLSHYQVNPDLPDHWKEAHRRGLSGETSSNDNDVWLRQDGTMGWLRWAVVPWREPSGEIGGIILSAEDITESKQAEKKIEQQLNRITALRDIDQMITSSFDLRLTMNRIVSQIEEQLGADASAILILEPNSYSLEYVVTRGLREGTIPKLGVRLGQGLAGNVALDRRVVHHPDLRAMVHSIPELKILTETGFIDYYGIPLISKGQIMGVLEVFHRSSLSPKSDWLEYLQTLAGQAALAIDHFQMFAGLQRSNFELAQAYDATIEGWSRALDLRDKETEGHTQRVADLSVELARAFGLAEKELNNIRWGALLHDIGKMGVPDAILLKPSALTDEEWIQMKKHPIFAYEMLSPIQYLRDALDIPHYHHEKWDGTGYPMGLKGEQIPLAARLFAIVDIWDAVRSDRPYRPAWSEEKALEYIKELSGTHLDPQVVKIFFESKIYEVKKKDK